MSKDKQIEEMAYEMTQYKEPVCKRIEDNKCLLRFHAHAFVDCHFCKLAEHLITEKGYRKASEVALEVIGEVEKIIDKYYDRHIFGVEDLSDVEQEVVMNFSDDITGDLNELKKKYTEERK